LSKENRYRRCSYCDKDSNSIEIRLHKETNTFVCPKHRSHLKRYGEIIHRTYRDLNEIIINKDFAEIILYDDKRLNPSEISRTLIDITNVEKCKDVKWHMSKAGYVFSSSKNVYLHEFILGKMEGFTIDHKDINPLNNLESNLRYADIYQQRANTKPHKDKASDYKGVYYRKGKWESKLKHKGIYYRLGRYETEIEGAKAYDEKALELFGEFANLNIKESI
jgi:hypothetical protein